MFLFQIILSVVMGGCFGFSVMEIFTGDLHIGLGVLAIGIFIAIWYLAFVVCDVFK